jgi:HK97 family phage major capsid protein
MMCQKYKSKSEKNDMRKRRYFNGAGEKRKFYNNVRHFGGTRSMSIAALGMLPVLGIIGAVIGLAFAVMHFGPQTSVAIKGHARQLSQLTALGVGAALTPRAGVVDFKRKMSLQQKRADFVKANTKLLDAAEKENRDLTPAENAVYETNISALTKISGELGEIEAATDKFLKGVTRTPVEARNNPGSGVEVLPQAKFGTIAEQLQAVARFAVTDGASRDPRLVAIGSKEYVGIMEASGIKAAAGMNEGVPSEGGFLVQSDTAEGVLERVYETGQILQLCNDMEISNPANRLKFNAIDEVSRANGSRFGGIQSFWSSEAQTATPTKPKFRQGELILNKLMAFCFATDELLNDAAALNSTITRDVPLELNFRLEDGVCNGPGNGQPQGFLKSPSLIVQTKEAAQATATLNSANIFKMWSRVWGPSRRNAAWLIDQSVEPQLYTLTVPSGTGISTPIYLPPGGISGNMYGTLFGRPVIPVEYLAPLGSQGDIACVDLNQYILARKGMMQAAQSMHVNFLTDEMCFRFTMRADGQPQWNNPLTPKSGGPTLSPFVVLQARP